MFDIKQVQNYWNERPCNIRHSNKEVGTKEYYEEVRLRKYLVEPHILEFADFYKWGRKHVLEIGCGIGTDTISFIEKGAYVSAIDISERSLELTKWRLMAYGYHVLGHANFYHGDAEELSKVIPVSIYDLIYSFGVIHHSPHPEKIIEQVKKYMDPTSEFRLMVYHKWSWKVLWILLKYGKGQFWKLDELIAKYSEAQTGCPITYTYTKKSVRDLLKGFEILECKVDHIFPYEIESYKRYEYKKVWYFRLMPEKVFRWLESKIGWHLCIRCRLK